MDGLHSDTYGATLVYLDGLPCVPDGAALVQLVKVDLGVPLVMPPLMVSLLVPLSSCQLTTHIPGPETGVLHNTRYDTTIHVQLY